MGTWKGIKEGRATELVGRAAENSIHGKMGIYSESGEWGNLDFMC